MIVLPQLSGQDLDAYLPRLGPYRDLQIFHHVKHTWEDSQYPMPTALQTKNDILYFHCWRQCVVCSLSITIRLLLTNQLLNKQQMCQVLL